MEHDGFDYEELRRNVDDLLDEEFGIQEDVFDVQLDDSDLPEMDFPVRNAANGYGVREEPQLPGYDEEAAAMHYNPQTNSGAVIRAYNPDYATRAAQKANRGNPRPPQRPERGELTQKLPRQSRYSQPVLQKTYEQSYAVHEEAPMSRQRVREMPPGKKKPKKHRFLKFLLVLILLLALFVAAVWMFARQPGKRLGAHRDRCTAILLAGTDADGMRTDTMMLLYMDKASRELNLLSLPRDTYTSMDVSVPKLNAVYGTAGGGKEGMERLLDYSEECIGYRPDGYVLVDLDCFERLVNLMGGVRFDVPCDMTYDDPSQDLHINLCAGEQRLNGKEAMWVVRFRSGYALADLQRVQVQRDFIRSALGQWLTIKNIWKAPAAATLLTVNTTTNLSIQELAWLAKTAKEIGTGNMQTNTLPGEAAYIGGGSYYVLWPETTAKLINEHYNPYEEEISSDAIYSPYY